MWLFKFFIHGIISIDFTKLVDWLVGWLFACQVTLETTHKFTLKTRFFLTHKGLNEKYIYFFFFITFFLYWFFLFFPTAFHFTWENHWIFSWTIFLYVCEKVSKWTRKQFTTWTCRKFWLREVTGNQWLFVRTNG